MLRNLFASFTWLQAELLHCGFGSGYSSPCIFQVTLGDAGFALTARRSVWAQVAFGGGFRATGTTVGFLNGGNLHVWLQEGETWVNSAPTFLLSSLVSHNLKLSKIYVNSVSFWAHLCNGWLLGNVIKHLGNSFWEESQKDNHVEKRQVWEEEIHLTCLMEMHMLTFSFTRHLLILGGTRQETRGSHSHRGVSSENAGNSQMKGCESPRHINSGDWRIMSQECR